MHDVLVLGDGVIALCAALAFRKRGYDVAMVLKKKLPNTRRKLALEAKVCAINRPSEHIFRQLGVWSLIQDKTFYDHVLIWDAHHGEDILFSAAECAEPNLGHIIAYEAMRQALIKAVRDTKIKTYVDSLKEVKFEATGSQCITETTTIEAQLVIGAEGAQSWLKHHLGIDSVVTDYAQEAIGAVIHHDSPHYHTARQRFMPSGPLALLPLNDLHHSALVWSVETGKAQRLKHLNQQQFEFELMAHYQGRMGKMQLVGERQAFPLRAHHAKQYGRPGALLMGDAAHTVHPLAGQGLNLGLMDVAACIDLLDEHALSSASLVAAYTQQQHRHNECMRQAMTVCQNMFHVAHPVWVKCRSVGMRLLDGCSSIKRQLSLLALGYQAKMPSLTQPLEHQEAS